MKNSFSIVLSIAIFLLGVFELVVAIELLLFYPNKTLTHRHNLYPPSIVSSMQGRYIICALTAFLGFNRLAWAFSYGTFGPWVAIVLTHACELLLVWGLAVTSYHFNPSNLPLWELILSVLTVQVGTVESTTVLLAVPTALVLLLMHGPNYIDVKRKKK